MTNRDLLKTALRTAAEAGVPVTIMGRSGAGTLADPFIQAMLAAGAKIETYTCSNSQPQDFVSSGVGMSYDVMTGEVKDSEGKLVTELYGVDEAFELFPGIVLR